MKTKKCKYCEKELNERQETFCSNKCAKFSLYGLTKKQRQKNARKSDITNRKNKIGFYGISKEQRQETIKKSNATMKKNKLGFWNSEIQRKNGIKGGKKSAMLNKKNKVGFWNPEIGRKGGKIGGKKAAITNKKNKTGFWNPDKKIQIKGGKRSQELHPKLMKKWQSMGGKIGWKNCIITNKKNGTGFYDSKTQIMGGLAAQHILRVNIRNLKYKGQYYDSKPEIEISICLQEQFNYIPKEKKTLHIRIGNREYDYLLKYLKLFIEYHPWFQKENEEEYYNHRRENLDNNNFKNYKLIVIK